MTKEEMRKANYNDWHGYEISGLEEAKTKIEKIAAYENHLFWLRNKEIEVKHEIERRIIQLKNYNKNGM